MKAAGTRVGKPKAATGWPARCKATLASSAAVITTGKTVTAKILSGTEPANGTGRDTAVALLQAKRP
jgi:hypothetical protein